MQVATVLRVSTFVFYMFLMQSCTSAPERLHWRVVTPNQFTASNEYTEPSTRTITLNIDEGTLMNVDVSPSGELLTFDLLGDIYLLPIDGGVASPITSSMAWDQAPRFSPDGQFIYFVSDRIGAQNIWRINLDNKKTNQVTYSESDVVGAPNWSFAQDKLIVGIRGAADTQYEYFFNYVDPEIGEATPINEPVGPWYDWKEGKTLRPRVMTFAGVQADDDMLYFHEVGIDRTGGKFAQQVKLYEYDLRSKKRTQMTVLGESYAEYRPQVSRDGSLLAYYRQYGDRRTELRLFNRKDETDSLLVELENADDAIYGASQDNPPNFAFTPDNNFLIFWHAGKLNSVEIETAHRKVIPFRALIEKRVFERVEPPKQVIARRPAALGVRWPSISQDGTIVTFSAVGYVWKLDGQTGSVKRLTNSSSFEYMPTISPDGGSIAFVEFTIEDNEISRGRLVISDIEGRAQRVLLEDSDSSYLLPRWSRDGGMIALLKETDSDASREASVGWTPISGGSFNEVAKLPSSSSGLATFLYSRSIDFDDSGRRLLFTYPTDRHETALAVVDLDAENYRIIGYGATDVGGIIPNPDMSEVALIQHTGDVWLVPLDSSDVPVSLTTTKSNARLLANVGGYYVHWNGPDSIVSGGAQRIFKTDTNTELTESVRVNVPIDRPNAKYNIAFRGAQIITMTGTLGPGRVIPNGTILVEGMRIAQVGPSADVKIPDNAIIVDVSGKTIMPGMLDTHYHSMAEYSRFPPLVLPCEKMGDRSAIAYGVTTVWEPGGPTNDASSAFVDLQIGGRLIGPRWSHSSGAEGLPFPIDGLKTYEDVAESVRLRRELGVAVLKEYELPYRIHRQWLGAAARKNSVGVIAHLQSYEEMMTRVIDGYSGGEHFPLPAPLYKDATKLLAETGFILTPNVVIADSNIASQLETTTYFWQEALQRYPNELAKLKAVSRPSSARLYSELGDPVRPYDHHRVSRISSMIADAAVLGVKIGVSAHNSPGILLHEEMWHLWKAGMSTSDVLRAVTMVNAEKIGMLDEVGSLESGKIADFLILTNSPLDNILNTLSLEYTVQGGVVYDSNTAERVDPDTLN